MINMESKPEYISMLPLCRKLCITDLRKRMLQILVLNNRQQSRARDVNFFEFLRMWIWRYSSQSCWQACWVSSRVTLCNLNVFIRSLCPCCLFGLTSFRRTFTHYSSEHVWQLPNNSLVWGYPYCLSQLRITPSFVKQQSSRRHRVAYQIVCMSRRSSKLCDVSCLRFYPRDGGTMLLQVVDNLLQVYPAGVRNTTIWVAVLCSVRFVSSDKSQPDGEWNALQSLLLLQLV